MMGLFIVLLLIVVLVGAVISLYNSLVRGRNQVKEAWAQVDVQLKRRFDLIPNLMETVKGYMHHERETLEAVTNARASVAGAGASIGERAQAEGGLSAALGRLFAVSENYPDLKASQNFLALQEELTSTENKIGFARQFYNQSVMSFNNRIQMFPGNIVAGMFNFEAGEFFELKDDAQREAPKVSF